MPALGRAVAVGAAVVARSGQGDAGIDAAGFAFGAGVRRIGCVGAVGPAARDADGIAMAPGRVPSRRRADREASSRTIRGPRAAGVTEAAASDATGWTTGATVCPTAPRTGRERLRHRCRVSVATGWTTGASVCPTAPRTGVSGCAHRRRERQRPAATTGRERLRHRRGERRGRLRHRRDRLCDRAEHRRKPTA